MLPALDHDPHPTESDATRALAVKLQRARRALATQRLDRLTPPIVAALAAAGVPCIVLKGPATRQWLYRPDELRTSCDVDLLVSPASLRRAHAVLRNLGFAKRCFWRVTSTWERANDHVTVDLHHSLTHLSAPPRVVWDALFPRVVPMQLAGNEVPVLDEAGRAFHLALHHAEPHGRRKAAEDLRRAIARLDLAGWRAAAALARQVGGERNFVTGLRLLDPEGRLLADQLGLPAAITPALALEPDSSATAILNDLLAPGTPGQLLRTLAALVDPRAFQARQGLSAGSPAVARPSWSQRLTQLARELPAAFATLRREHRRLREPKRAQPPDR